MLKQDIPTDTVIGVTSRITITLIQQWINQLLFFVHNVFRFQPLCKFYTCISYSIWSVYLHWIWHLFLWFMGLRSEVFLRSSWQIDQHKTQIAESQTVATKYSQDADRHAKNSSSQCWNKRNSEAKCANPLQTQMNIFFLNTDWLHSFATPVVTFGKPFSSVWGWMPLEGRQLIKMKSTLWCEEINWGARRWLKSERLHTVTLKR